MKLKNLNFVEKYIEKILLAVAVVFFLGVFWLKVMGVPYTVTLDKKTVTPGQIGETLFTDAIRLDQALMSEDPHIKAPEIPKYDDDFVKNLTTRTTPGAFKLPFGPPGLDRDDFTIGEGLADYYFVPDPPPAMNLAARQGFGVMAEPGDVQLALVFEDLIGTRRPWDFRWVSVSAEFDRGLWRTLLAAEPPANMQQLPDRWWDRSLSVTDVILERQTWDPNRGGTGDWPNEDQWERIDLLPNLRFPYRNPKTNWAPTEATAEVALIRSNQEEIAQPPFPDLAVGKWKRPDVDLTPQQWREFERLNQDIRAQQQQIRQQMQEPTTRRVNRRGGADQADSDLEELQRGLEQLLARRDRLIGKDTKDTEDALEDDPNGEAEDQDDENDADQADILTVWAHDITAKPGMKYRYRISVAVVNPIFQENDVPEQQKKDFKQILSITSPASDWSEGITVEPATPFFLATPDTVEVYYIFNGKWSFETFSPQPGDWIGDLIFKEIGGERYDIDLNVGALVVDIENEAPGMGLRATTTRLTYWETITGQLLQRTVEVDKDSEERRQIRDESAF